MIYYQLLLPTSYFLLLTSYFLLLTIIITSYFLLLTSYYYYIITSYFLLLTSYFLLLKEDLDKKAERYGIRTAKYTPSRTPRAPPAPYSRRGSEMTALGKAKAIPRTAPGAENAH